MFWRQKPQAEPVKRDDQQSVIDAFKRMQDDRQLIASISLDADTRRSAENLIDERFIQTLFAYINRGG